jgi:hypothetical protein
VSGPVPMGVHALVDALCEDEELSDDHLLEMISRR